LPEINKPSKEQIVIPLNGSMNKNRNQEPMTSYSTYEKLIMEGQSKAVISKKKKQDSEMNMISSMVMPDSVIMSHEQLALKPQQNNLLASQ
jgi:hypothetical protein